MPEDIAPWRLKAREWAERQEQERTRPAAVVHDADLIPESEYDDDPIDMEVDRIVDGVDILDAYARWCGKMVPEPGGKRESVMISCPKPDHADKTPSAWINLDKQTWFCGGCQEGGDTLDIAAYFFGYPVPGYKNGKSFPDLRRDIAEEFGLFVRKTPGGQRYAEQVIVEPVLSIGPPGSERVPRPKPSFSVPLTDFSGASPALRLVSSDDGSSNGVTPLSLAPPAVKAIPAETLKESGISPDSEPRSDSDATVTDIGELFLDIKEAVNPPSIPWREIVTDVGFMDEWISATSHDDLPEEYYFILGLMALGLAVGRDASMADRPEVRGNLFTCLLGPSGEGKSRSIGVFQRLLDEALPYDETDPDAKGTQVMSPGSAEALIDGFCKPIIDPSDPKVVMGFGAVRGLVRFDELSTLVGRSVRTGSVLKPTLMEFYDGYGDVTHRTRGVGMIRAAGHFAAAVTTSQPRAIKDLLTTADADSGFLNRWIFAMGPSKPARSFGGVAFDITRAVVELKKVQTWAAVRPRNLLPTADALATWDEHFRTTLMPFKRGADTDPLFARIDLTMKKIMFLLAVDRKHDAIEQEDVADALRMWDYLVRSYQYVSGQIGFGQFEEIHQAVMWAVQLHHEKRGEAAAPTMRDISRSLHRRKYPIDVLGRVVQAMIGIGELREEIVKPTRGPVSTRYRYVK